MLGFHKPLNMQKTLDVYSTYTVLSSPSFWQAAATAAQRGSSHAWHSTGVARAVKGSVELLQGFRASGLQGFRTVGLR